MRQSAGNGRVGGRFPALCVAGEFGRNGEKSGIQPGKKNDESPDDRGRSGAVLLQVRFLTSGENQPEDSGSPCTGEKIVYIQNAKRLRSGRITDDFDAKLLVLSEHVFSKEQADAFTSEKLLAFLQSERISEVELAGIDGNSCISASAKGALQKGYAVSVNLSCTGVANPLRFERTKAVLSSLGVLLI